MAFPTPQGTAATTATSANALTVSCNLPTGRAAGEMLVAVIAVDGIPTLSVSTGWTLVGKVNQAASGGALALAWRIATADTLDALTVTATATEQFNVSIARIAGHDGAAPTWTAVSRASVTNPAFPTHTPAGGAADFLWIAVADANSTTTMATPTSYTLVSYVNAPTTANETLGRWSRQLNAASETPSTPTFGTARPSVLGVISVKGASATGVTGSHSQTVAVGSSGEGAVAVTGSHAQAVPVASSGAGTVAVQGDHAQAIAVASAATGTSGNAGVTGSHAQTVAVGSAAAGAVAVQGAHARAVPVASAGAGAVTVQGTHAGAIAVGSAAAGTVRVAGASTQAVAILSAASGGVRAAGSHAQAIAILASAQGTASGTRTGAHAHAVSVLSAGTLRPQPPWVAVPPTVAPWAPAAPPAAAWALAPVIDL